MLRSICVSAGLLVAVPCLAEPPGREEKPATDLDDLFDGLPRAEEKTKPAEPADPLVEGEDIELGGSKDPFARIAAKMQRSQDALQAKRSDEPTQQLQDEILLDLDTLLKQMEKKCSGGQCNNPGSASSGGKPKAGSQKTAAKPNDSTARLDKPKETSVDARGNAESALREVWGHLPPKVREAMQNATAEEFLPKYDRLIEAFYRRLAEQSPREGS
jgi:hypothetical protein